MVGDEELGVPSGPSAEDVRQFVFSKTDRKAAHLDPDKHYTSTRRRGAATAATAAATAALATVTLEGALAPLAPIFPCAVLLRGQGDDQPARMYRTMEHALQAAKCLAFSEGREG